MRCGGERRAKKYRSQSRCDGTAMERKRVGEGWHAAALPVTQRVALSYTIRVLSGSRTCGPLFAAALDDDDSRHSRG